MSPDEITRDIIVALIPKLDIAYGDIEKVSKAVTRLYKDIYKAVVALNGETQVSKPAKGKSTRGEPAGPQPLDHPFSWGA
jgi:hypothetical protein